MKPSSEFMKVARNLSRELLDLDRTSRDVGSAGYFQNTFGGYWRLDTFGRLVALYREAIDLAPDDLERNAARYALAALFKNALLLHEAAQECEALIEARPARAYADQSLLAFVEARRGDLARAKELARIVNANPDASSFRVDEADLEREYEAGRG